MTLVSRHTFHAETPKTENVQEPIVKSLVRVRDVWSLGVPEADKDLNAFFLLFFFVRPTSKNNERDKVQEKLRRK